MKEKYMAAIPVEIILLLLAVSTNLIKDVLNPDLIKFIEKKSTCKIYYPIYYCFYF